VRRALRILSIWGGMGAAVLGLLAGLAVAVSPWLLADAAGDGGPLTRATMAAALAAAGGGVGLPLAWTARRSLRGIASPLVRWHSWWLWAALALLVAGGGQAVLLWARLPWLFFPLLYVLGIVLPVLAVLTLVGGRLARHGLAVTRREIWAQLASGGLLSTAVALILEAALFFCLVLAAIAGLVLTPDGLQLLQTIWAQLQAAGGVPDAAQLMPLLRSGWFVALALLGMAVVAPAVEEGVKALGVPLLGYRRPGAARAFLWGVAGGAGLALVEGLLNGVLAVGGGQAWGLAVLARTGTVIVHCLAGGLAGLGWQALLSGARRWWALGYYAAAVTLHGLWNGLAGAAAFVQLISSEDAGEVIAPQMGTLGVGILAMLMAGLLAAQLVLLLFLADRLGRGAARQATQSA